MSSNPVNTSSSPIRLALLASSPIPYHIPLYRRLASDPRLALTVIFATNAGVRPHDPGYGQPIVWDVDLLNGYCHVFLKRAGSNRTLRKFLSLRDYDVIPELVRSKYDVLWIHGYSFLTHQLAAWAMTLQGRPVLLREEQTLIHPRPLWKHLLKLTVLRLLLRRAYALYIGTENRRWFEKYGARADRTVFVPYVADNDRLSEAAASLRGERQQLQREFGISAEGGPVVLTVSRLTAGKQPLFVLEAFRRVRQLMPCQLLIVGSGEMVPRLVERIREEHIPDVHLAGFVNQSRIARAYAVADVFVLASKLHETWGMVVNEAMNFRLPIVLSDKVGSGIDLVREGSNGFVIRHDEVGQLADRLETLVGSPEMRRRFGEASEALIRAWSVEKAASGILTAVELAVGPERWSSASHTTATTSVATGD